MYVDQISRKDKIPFVRVYEDMEPILSQDVSRDQSTAALKKKVQADYKREIIYFLGNEINGRTDYRNQYKEWFSPQFGAPLTNVTLTTILCKKFRMTRLSLFSKTSFTELLRSTYAVGDSRNAPEFDVDADYWSTDIADQIKKC